MSIRFVASFATLAQEAARSLGRERSAILARAGDRDVVVDALSPTGYTYVDRPCEADAPDGGERLHDPLALGDGVVAAASAGGGVRRRTAVAARRAAVVAQAPLSTEEGPPYAAAVHVPPLPPRVVWAPRNGVRLGGGGAGELCACVGGIAFATQRVWAESCAITAWSPRP